MLNKDSRLNEVNYGYLSYYFVRNSNYFNKIKKIGYPNFMKNFKITITFFILIIVYCYVANITLIPEHIILLENEPYKIKKLIGVDTIETITTSNDNENTVNMEVTLFGNKVKNVTIDTLENVEVVPIGKIIGMKLYTNGVLIVGMSQIENADKQYVSPFVNCDIQEGDTIIKVNDKEIDNIGNLKEVVNDSNGENVLLTLIRNGSIVTSNITPVQTEDDEYKLGLWVKDAATGVGTMTYYEKNTGSFAALGHGIMDSDTEQLIDIESGEIVTSSVMSITKADINSPGEIRGTIMNQKTIGEVEKNTQFGIYGKLDNLTSLNIDTNQSLPVALRNEIQVGDATLLCSLDGKTTQEYKIKIEKIFTNNNYDNKSMLIRVVDDALIKNTGGIIRGLSGSPIVQNGKFVGAVTNVLVSNPEIGYAIFGDMMIKEMRK